MGNISQSQMKGIFTKAYLQKYNEMIPAPSFIRSFFPSVTTTAKEIHFEVRRGTEKIAVDVLRGTNGNRNTFSKSSEKAFIPPYYHETFEATELDRYDVVFGEAETMNPTIIGYLASDVAEKFAELRNKIERAKELQAVQVLETGIVTLSNATSVDYKRKAGSLVDNSAAPWSTAASDIESQLIAAGNFLRQTGKNGNPEFDLIISGAAFVNLKKSNYFTNAANWRQVSLVDITRPQKTAFGAAYHGQIFAGAYVFNVWTYDEGYENSGGTFTRYTNTKKAIVLPTMGARFVMAHAGVPAIMGRPGRDGQFIGSVAGEYYRSDYIDPARKSHTFEIMSAPLAMPITVDMIYTMQIEA